MNTAYNNNTTVQESRNRYNQLLQAALKRINDRKRSKTAQEPEEVTTATPEEVTTPTEASKPEQVTATAPSKTNKTRRTKTASPKVLGRDAYHIFTDPLNPWITNLDSGIYHDPERYALLSDNQILIGSRLDYYSEWAGKLIKENGTASNRYKNNELACLLKVRLTGGAVYTIEPNTIAKKIREAKKDAKYKKAREIFGDGLSVAELDEKISSDKQAKRATQTAHNYSFAELTLPNVGTFSIHRTHLERFIKVSKRLALSELRVQENKIQFEGFAGFVLVALATTKHMYMKPENTITIDLTDATPAPEDTTTIEATPATAPQATEEVTTAHEEVATVETTVNESEQETTEEATVPEEETTATDDATVLRNLIDQYGNVGADYLDTLDYSKATKQEPRTVTSGRAKVTEKRYTISTPDEFGYLQTYGLSRSYNRNGKRNMFFVPKGWEIIEMRWYGKNNNTYKASVKIEAGTLRYQIEDGIVTRAELTKKDGNKMKATFNDDNRPATPRDLPAPAPSKATKQASKPTKEESEATNEAPATTVQKQETSKQAPTPEATPVPEEVKEVTTSNQENGPVPYWLLLDNELRKQEIDLEITKEEAAVLAMEKEQEEAVANVEFLTGPELDKAIAEYIERNGLDLKLEKGYYYFYITTDGYIVKLNKNKPRKDLYIPDEGPFYESYKKGEVTDRSIFFSRNLETLDDYARESMRNVNYCRVERTEDGTLSIDTNNLRPEYECDKETGTYKEIPVKHPTHRELAVYVAAWNAYEADQRERLEKYWKRYSDKVCVNTYWANR